ncbi:hypothetical protein CEXT_88111 [Caerostris extrusa]|uniref:Uncharacterized protein n=1 Tax=Caerostris extrusa TaxID=172846 RepID=A0AAV4P479_CAEEX|nr:hypothetical protein CEXT_88111 [Caerostris extrusa]
MIQRLKTTRKMELTKLQKMRLKRKRMKKKHHRKIHLMKMPMRLMKKITKNRQKTLNHLKTFHLNLKNQMQLLLRDTEDSKEPDINEEATEDAKSDNEEENAPGETNENLDEDKINDTKHIPCRIQKENSGRSWKRRRTRRRRRRRKEEKEKKKTKTKKKQVILKTPRKKKVNQILNRKNQLFPQKGGAAAEDGEDEKNENTDGNIENESGEKTPDLNNESNKENETEEKKEDEIKMTILDKRRVKRNQRRKIKKMPPIKTKIIKKGTNLHQKV